MVFVHSLNDCLSLLARRTTVWGWIPYLAILANHAHILHTILRNPQNAPEGGQDCTLERQFSTAQRARWPGHGPTQHTQGIRNPRTCANTGTGNLRIPAQLVLLVWGLITPLTPVWKVSVECQVSELLASAGVADPFGILLYLRLEGVWTATAWMSMT